MPLHVNTIDLCYSYKTFIIHVTLIITDKLNTTISLVQTFHIQKTKKIATNFLVYCYYIHNEHSLRLSLLGGWVHRNTCIA